MAVPESVRRRAKPSVIVAESLSALFSPVVLRKVLREACQVAGVASVPESPVALQVFVEGALFTTLARRLGFSTALELNSQLREALHHVDPKPDAQSTCEMPISEARERARVTEPASGHLALVVTKASLVVFLLQDQFGDAVEVLPVSGDKELKDRVRRFGGRPLLVVIDRRHPCVGPRVARMLHRELAAGSSVVWWGADEAEVVEVEAMLSGGPRFIPTASDARLADLGTVCLSAIA